MRAAGHLSVKFGRGIGALASDINGLRGSVLCDGSLRFLASGEKPKLEGKSNLLRMRRKRWSEARKQKNWASATESRPNSSYRL